MLDVDVQGGWGAFKVGGFVPKGVNDVIFVSISDSVSAVFPRIKFP